MSIDNSHKIEDVKILLAKGVDGVGIEKIEKTGSSGIVDTYTITYTDSRKTTFEITNGNGIESIEKTSTVLLNDVYTITYEDGSTTTYNVTNGRGIDRIEKTSTAGAVDTYTIYYNDNTTSTYTVTNGQGAVAEDISFTNNGEGATNVQDAVDNTLKLVAPIQLTLTADKTYNVGDQFVYNGLLYEVTATIAQGTPITVGSNVQLADTVAEQLTAINSNLSTILPQKIAETGTSSITWSQKLNMLESAFDGLSDEKKKGAYLLIRGRTIVRCVDIVDKVFSNSAVNTTEVIVQSFRVANKQYIYYNSYVGNVVNGSNNTSDANVELWA